MICKGNEGREGEVRRHKGLERRDKLVESEWLDSEK